MYDFWLYFNCNYCNYSISKNKLKNFVKKWNFRAARVPEMNCKITLYKNIHKNPVFFCQAIMLQIYLQLTNISFNYIFLLLWTPFVLILKRRALTINIAIDAATVLKNERKKWRIKRPFVFHRRKRLMKWQKINLQTARHIDYDTVTWIRDSVHSPAAWLMNTWKCMLEADLYFHLLYYTGDATVYVYGGGDLSDV